MAVTEFKAATDQFRRKIIAPTYLTSSQILGIDSSIRRAALFSAQTANAGYLQKIMSVVDSILAPKTVMRDGLPVTEGMNFADARLALKEALDKISYQPKPGEAGTIQDLRSDGRLNLITTTQVEMSQGFGQMVLGQDETILDQWPAQELFRAEDRKEERDWNSRWKQAATAANDGNAYRVLSDYGVMIAMKDSVIWDMLGELWDDSLGNPYPPFAFRSGMWIRDVDRDKAIELGLCDSDAKVQPREVMFKTDESAW